MEAYVALLMRWQNTHNLIGRATLAEVWSRHVVDSAQLWPLLPEAPVGLADFGSGAGLPGLVLAILGAHPVHLIERDQKKVAFLREAVRTTGCRAQVHACDLRELRIPGVRVVTARAVAPLTQLLEFAAAFQPLEHGCLFLKGQNVDEELTEAAKGWHMEVELSESTTNRAGRIVQVKNFHRR